MRSHSFFHIDGGFGQTSNRFTDVGTFDTVGISRDFANRNIRLFLQPGIYTGNGPVEFGMGVRLQWANEVQLDAAPQAVPEISAKGLAPSRPQHMEYSAPSEDGGVEHGEMESVDGGFIEIDPNASRAERRRLERENRKRS
jgi:hypothetical protein